MNQKIFKITVSLFLSGLLFLCVSAYAQDIKTRMKDRLPVIKALKMQGIIGENNRGYLQFPGDKREKEDVVAAENQDRKTVYSAIAKQQNTTVEVVEKHRAAQIETKAEPGEWLQDANGKWYRHK
ncbi:MAG TPA: YdbL family protein [Desulfobacterales bacterium]|mgnify:CR=1 FL=1|nr:YdbL family protein [Desulfobacterales bacterium]